MAFNPAIIAKAIAYAKTYAQQFDEAEKKARLEQKKLLDQLALEQARLDLEKSKEERLASDASLDRQLKLLELNQRSAGALLDFMGRLMRGSSQGGSGARGGGLSNLQNPAAVTSLYNAMKNAPSPESAVAMAQAMGMEPYARFVGLPTPNYPDIQSAVKAVQDASGGGSDAAVNLLMVPILAKIAGLELSDDAVDALTSLAEIFASTTGAPSTPARGAVTTQSAPSGGLAESESLYKLGSQLPEAQTVQPTPQQPAPQQPPAPAPTQQKGASEPGMQRAFGFAWNQQDYDLAKQVAQNWGVDPNTVAPTEIPFWRWMVGHGRQRPTSLLPAGRAEELAKAREDYSRYTEEARRYYKSEVSKMVADDTAGAFKEDMLTRVAVLAKEAYEEYGIDLTTEAEMVAMLNQLPVAKRRLFELKLALMGADLWATRVNAWATQKRVELDAISALSGSYFRAADKIGNIISWLQSQQRMLKSGKGLQKTVLTAGPTEALDYLVAQLGLSGQVQIPPMAGSKYEAIVLGELAYELQRVFGADKITVNNVPGTRMPVLQGELANDPQVKRYAAEYLARLLTALRPQRDPETGQMVLILGETKEGQMVNLHAIGQIDKLIQEFRALTEAGLETSKQAVNVLGGAPAPQGGTAQPSGSASSVGDRQTMGGPGALPWWGGEIGQPMAPYPVVVPNVTLGGGGSQAAGTAQTTTTAAQPQKTPQAPAKPAPKPAPKPTPKPAANPPQPHTNPDIADKVIRSVTRTEPGMRQLGMVPVVKMGAPNGPPTPEQEKLQKVIMWQGIELAPNGLPGTRYRSLAEIGLSPADAKRLVELLDDVEKRLERYVTSGRYHPPGKEYRSEAARKIIYKDLERIWAEAVRHRVFLAVASGRANPKLLHAVSYNLKGGPSPISEIRRNPSFGVNTLLDSLSRVAVEKKVKRDINTRRIEPTLPPGSW